LGPDSLLTGENAAFMDQEYLKWLQEPGAVDPGLASVFASWDLPTNGDTPRSPTFYRRSIFAGGNGVAVAEASLDASLRQARVAQMINAHRVRGHLKADLDPLGRKKIISHPELDPHHFGLQDEDLDKVVSTSPLFGMPPTAYVKDVLRRVDAVYCKSIGVEVMNIHDNRQRLWVLERMETLPDRHVMQRPEELRFFRKMCDAENFERMLHNRFPGTKRFSLEGGETLIPLLDMAIDHASQQGVHEMVFGMAHRGRLNTLVNILGKPASAIVEEFQDAKGVTQGSGDVKYHLGYNGEVTTAAGKVVSLTLTPNPSHLEAVNPVVEGRARARQERAGLDLKGIMPVLIHGDAAFIGQGVVSETFNLSELPGFATGGTLHIVINNQIGFTTDSNEARSTLYSSDLARMLAIPIFHVNGEDPRAVAAVVEIAIAWRQTFGRDVVIDMYCYRKHGHNEGDEPSYTQPLMYELIRSRPTPRGMYAQRLAQLGDLTAAECDQIYELSFQEMMTASEPVKKPVRKADDVDWKGSDPDADGYFETTGADPNAARPVPGITAVPELKGVWWTYSGGSIYDRADTRVDPDHLRALLERCNTLPEGFQPHWKVKALYQQRLDMLSGRVPMDWGFGEQAAYASLVDEGFTVRLSGEDCGRGTFSHRHAVLYDVRDENQYIPIQHLREGQGAFSALDGTLSEFGVLGFEVGYSMDRPDALVLWEAQFGDFANGAQVIIDQFIVACEQKWAWRSGVVLLLPHGYAGQGPEHSSARLERFLQLYGDENIQVVNITTPANYFHLLRQQMKRKVRKPLVVMTPKELLRDPQCTSTFDELASGSFQPLISDPRPLDPAKVKRLLLVSGKLYYELRAKAAELGDESVALVRVERIAPVPADEIRAELARFPDAELVWCQEEPKNQGSWPMMLHWLLDALPGRPAPRYVGRPAAASPATGSYKRHKAEQSAIVEEAFRF
jgi:2-oxoglutarate dehydrogenase E1 component